MAELPIDIRAGIWRDMPKVVYSRSLKRADWNATVVAEVVPSEVQALKAQPGGDLVLGRGTPMLQPSDAKVQLRLIETHTFGNGVVMLRYERP